MARVARNHFAQNAIIGARLPVPQEISRSL
jgi:hypothetical protein